jgi:hypothetical protein
VTELAASAASACDTHDPATTPHEQIAGCAALIGAATWPSPRPPSACNGRGNAVRVRAMAFGAEWIVNKLHQLS